MTPNVQFNSSAISAGDCISQGWNMIKPQYWLFFGIAFLAFVITGCIPILNFFLMGPILAGVYIVFFTYMRRQPVDFGMMFKGFDNFVPAMVVGLIQAIPGIIQLGVRFTIDIGQIVRQILKSRGIDLPNTNYLAQSSTDSSDLMLSGALISFLIIFSVVMLIVSIVWHLAFFFAIPLIADKKLGAIDAIKLSARAGFSNAGGLILLAILEGIVAILGFFACGIGIFFVLPVIYAANAIAYRQVFPDTPPQNFNAPPQPQAYGGSYGQPM